MNTSVEAAGKHRLASRFILLVGITNLFADMTYEGARGVNGAFLGQLGASGAIVGFVAGSGELAGYIIRSISGVFGDRTGRYWIDVWVGYIINMRRSHSPAHGRRRPVSSLASASGVEFAVPQFRHFCLAPAENWA